MSIMSEIHLTAVAYVAAGAGAREAITCALVDVCPELPAGDVARLVDEEMARGWGSDIVADCLAEETYRAAAPDDTV